MVSLVGRAFQRLPEFTQIVSPNFEQAGFPLSWRVAVSTADWLTATRLSLRGRLSVIVSDDGRFERVVIFRIL